MADNTVTLVGNVTRDPELRYTSGGRGVASFGLAVNRRYQSNGEWQEQTSFFNVVAWGTLGENAAASLTRAPGSSSPAASSSARGRPRTARSAPRSRSSPTRSAPACAGRRPRSRRPPRTDRRRRRPAAGVRRRRPRRPRRPADSELRRRRAVLSTADPNDTDRQSETDGEQEERARAAKDAAPRKYKKKTSVLVIEKVEYVDYKDVNLLSRFMSDRAKIRNRRVIGQRRAAAARGRQRDQERPGDGAAAVHQARRQPAHPAAA